VLRRVLSATFAALALGAAASSAQAALPGDLDLSFSADGKVVTNLTTGFDSANGIAVQADLKIVAAGQAAGAGGRFALVRYESSGPLDTAGFGIGGKVFTNFTPGFDAAFDVALQGDKIVAVGRAGGAGGRFALARYNSDGSLDTTFGGGDGKVLTNFSAGDDFAYGVAIQVDGKIVAAGRSGGSGGVMAIARYKADDGSLDSTFGGGDGKVTINFTRGDDRADAVAIDAADGSIVVVGTAGYFNLNGKFAVARYDQDGIPDPGFGGGDGKLTTDFTPNFDGSFAVAVQANSDIVAAGQAGSNVGLARYLPSGSLDTGFGAAATGKVTTSFSRGADYADDVALDPGGNIVLAGASNFFGPDSRFALARYKDDGTLDTTFDGGDGKVTTNFTTGFDGAYDVEIDGDGRLVAGGYADRSGGRFAIARYVGTS